MQNILHWVLIVSAILLAFCILLQQKSSGLSATFGGGGNSYSSKRGLDRILVIATIFLAIIFFGGAVTYLFV